MSIKVNLKIVATTVCHPVSAYLKYKLMCSYLPIKSKHSLNPLRLTIRHISKYVNVASPLASREKEATRGGIFHNDFKLVPKSTVVVFLECEMLVGHRLPPKCLFASG